MTIEELSNQLSQLTRELESAPDDESTFELNLLAHELKKQVIAATFDPLAELESLGVADVKQLKSLVDAVEQAIEDEQRRTKLVTEIIAIAKTALKVAGVALPGFVP